LASQGDGEAWNDFVRSSPAGSFYLRYEWESVNRELLGHRTEFLLAELGGRVVGVLPLVFVSSRLFGRFLCSMPFVNLGGPAATDAHVEALLVAEACRRAEALQCDCLEIRGDRPLPGLASVSRKVSMTLALEADPDAIWDSFSRKHRKNIRKTYERGIEVRSGGEELLSDFYLQMSLGWRGLGTPLYAPEYFSGILERFGPDVRIFVAYLDGVPIGTALNGHFRDTVEGMWAAGDPEYRKLAPNYVLYWEMIKDACERGYRRFHLGRSSPDSGSVDFKAKWNAEAEPLHWNYHLVRAREIPALNPENPKYELAIRAWRRLPLSVTRILGSRIAPFIP
jgi:FemAB-related protein (PEP-CTERM system-associated)